MPQTMKSLKTPLRYPGGKSRALSKLFQYIPDLKDYTEYREPFLGGGSVALEVTKRYPRLSITVNDLYEPLYNFWRELQLHGNDCFYNLKRIYQVLQQKKPTLHILKTYGVLFLFMLLTSVLSQDSRKVPPSQNKQVIKTFPSQVLSDYEIIKN